MTDDPVAYLDDVMIRDPAVYHKICGLHECCDMRCVVYLHDEVI